MTELVVQIDIRPLRPDSESRGDEGITKSMRIAIFTECYLPVVNGVVTSIQTLRQTLRSWGHTVYIFAPGNPQNEDDADVFRLPELPFPRHPYHLARPFPRLNVDFEALGVDIIHCQHPFTVGRLGADTAKRFKIPMVYTAHSLYDTMAAVSKSPLMRTMGQRAVRGVVRRFCARADYVITPSRYTRDALRADGVKARYAVIPSGIITPVIPASTREDIRTSIGIKPDQPLILCLGRLGPEKRIDLLLHAITLVDGYNLPYPARDFRLALVGDGISRQELENMAAELGILERVLFLGAQPHETIGSWYAAADIFALSSPTETQGLVLVEAMAAGLPCVAVNYGGPREIVINGETGVRVPFDSEAFAHALELLLQDKELRLRFGENGLVRAASFSPEAMAEGVLAVYNAALRAPRIGTSAQSKISRVYAEAKRRRDSSTTGGLRMLRKRLITRSKKK